MCLAIALALFYVILSPPRRAPPAHIRRDRVVSRPDRRFLSSHSHTLSREARSFARARNDPSVVVPSSLHTR
uniref:Putative secreted protein n=1 Tax=Anopheles triannulatus TaxID=58253 RepID=A0A2M4B721_9DIPT